MTIINQGGEAFHEAEIWPCLTAPEEAGVAKPLYRGSGKSLTDEERTAWVAKLEEGDAVGIFRRGDLQARTRVARRAPTGRIITESRQTFGRFGSLMYPQDDDIYLGPLPDQEA
ncbi:hypothetical protein R5M92_04180 [Halomonas sp. Bachu 37]|uniref:hypothetical protein n=1 Tax=Halomonas kashgarensis TaxID=3084920 RepID=UPI003217BA2F